MSNEDARSRGVVAKRQARILAIGHEDFGARLREKTPGWCAIDERAALSEALRSLQLRGYDLIVLDPSVFRFESVAPLLRDAEDRGTGVVIYSVIDRDSAASIAKVILHFTCEFLAIGAENEAVLLERYLQRPNKTSAPSLVAHELAPNLLGLAPETRTTFLGLLGGMSIPDDMNAFVTQAHTTERGLERSCTRCKLAVPSLFLVGARVLRTWSALRASATISETALQFGWDSSDHYRKQFKRLAKATPTAARKRMQTGEFAHQVSISLRSSHSVERHH